MMCEPFSILIKTRPSELFGMVTVAFSPTEYSFLSVENESIVSPLGSVLEDLLDAGQSA